MIKLETTIAKLEHLEHIRIQVRPRQSNASPWLYGKFMGVYPHGDNHLFVYYPYDDDKSESMTNVKSAVLLSDILSLQTFATVNRQVVEPAALYEELADKLEGEG